jgi:hypothetical protein
MIQEAFAQWGHIAFLDPVLADWLEEQGEQLFAETVRAEQGYAVRYSFGGDGRGYGSGYGDGCAHGNGTGYGGGYSCGRGNGVGDGHGSPGVIVTGCGDFGSGDGDGRGDGGGRAHGNSSGDSGDQMRLGG